MKNYINITYKNKPKTEYPSQLIKWLFKHNGKGLLSGYTFSSYSRVLDLGSGRGDHLLAFCEHGFLAEGFDQCKPTDEIINKKYKITIGNLEKKLPYESNTFDIIFCKSVIEHLYYPEKVFQEVRRILKPGGAFVVMTPEWYSTKEIFYEDFTHRSPFTLKSVKDIFEINNFTHITCKLIRQLPFLWKEPWLLPVCKLAELFYNKDTKNKLIKFSKEKMILSIGIK
jgi:SAM-dependent methyltransferase